MALREYCTPDAILCQLEASDKEDAIRQMVDALVDCKALTRPKALLIVKEIIDRERQATTGIGKGIGIPHARSAHAKKISVAISRIQGGIDFGSVDGERVRVVILLISPVKDSVGHLAAMKTIVSMARDPYHCKRLHGCDTAASFLGLIEELEGRAK